MSDTDYSSASERAQLFRAATIKAHRLMQYSDLTRARFHEALEAVKALPSNERGPHVEPLIRLFRDNTKRLTTALRGVTEFIQCADAAPDFAKAGLEKTIENIRASHISNLRYLMNL